MFAAFNDLKTPATGIGTEMMDKQVNLANLHANSRARLSLAAFARALTVRLRLVVALPLVCAALAGTVAILIPDRYEASATLQVDPPRIKPKAAGSTEPSESTAQAIEAQIKPLKSAELIAQVIRDLNLQNDAELTAAAPVASLITKLGLGDAQGAVAEFRFAGRMSVSRIRNTLLVDVRYSSRDPKKAARITNGIIDAYLTWRAKTEHPAKAQEASPASDAATSPPAATADPIAAELARHGGSASDQVFQSLLEQVIQTSRLPGVRIIERAEEPLRPVGPHRRIIILLATASGLLLSIGGALMLDRAAPRPARPEEIQEELSCPYLSSIGAASMDSDNAQGANAARLVVAEPTGEYAAAILGARQSLEWKHGPGVKRVVLVVSSLAGEGAETFASNLAHHIALTGPAPLLIDADLQNRALSSQLAPSAKSGLQDKLAIGRRSEEAILRDTATGLCFLPAGELPDTEEMRPSEILALPAFAETISRLRSHFPMIVIAAPPLLASSDARIIADHVDQIVFVNAWHETSPRLARRALTTFGANSRKVVGAVLTGIIAGPEGNVMTFSEIAGEAKRALANIQSARRAA